MVYATKNLPRLLFLVLLFSPVLSVTSQEIVTASNFLIQVSDQYNKVSDYRGTFLIVSGRDVMEGAILYKNPNKIRMDFTAPRDQVLVSDGKILQIYMPRYSSVFNQELKRRSDTNVANLASAQGLHLLRNNYSVAYLVGPDPMPLDEGSEEMVTKLRLITRNANESFRQMEISVDKNLMIRRIIGTTTRSVLIQFDFRGIRTNVGLDDILFEYKSPPTANSIYNFLFEPEG